MPSSRPGRSASPPRCSAWHSTTHRGGDGAPRVGRCGMAALPVDPQRRGRSRRCPGGSARVASRSTSACSWAASLSAAQDGASSATPSVRKAPSPGARSPSRSHHCSPFDGASARSAASTYPPPRCSHQKCGSRPRTRPDRYSSPSRMTFVRELISAFLSALKRVGRARRRTGAVQWAVYREAEQPNQYIETFVVPTWEEHLRQHGRRTATDAELQDELRPFLRDGDLPHAKHYIAPPRTERRDVGHRHRRIRGVADASGTTSKDPNHVAPLASSTIASTD